jgi:5-methylcytosine-specific restriction endonuclease McrA
MNKMRKLPVPTDNVKEVFNNCISNFQSQELKNRFNLCEDEIANASLEFELKAINNLTHTIESQDKVAGVVTNVEMCKVYTDKMVKKSAPGRKFYDKYMAVPKNGICPFCGQRIVSTLDHYLPKMKYPALAVSPLNLIPACKDCNKDKGEKEFANSGETLIHPYFDDIDNEVWLSANVLEEAEIAISFCVIKPEAWSDLLYERVKNHFRLFGLNSLYSAHAAEEIENIRYMLVKLYKKAGSELVKEYLKEYLESSERVQLNSWKTAMYRALYENKWFWTQWIETLL